MRSVLWLTYFIDEEKSCHGSYQRNGGYNNVWQHIWIVMEEFELSKRGTKLVRRALEAAT